MLTLNDNTTSSASRLAIAVDHLTGENEKVDRSRRGIFIFGRQKKQKAKGVR
jgi:hypothetical protein